MLLKMKKFFEKKVQPRTGFVLSIFRSATVNVAARPRDTRESCKKYSYKLGNESKSFSQMSFSYPNLAHCVVFGCCNAPSKMAYKMFWWPIATDDHCSLGKVH